MHLHSAAPTARLKVPYGWQRWIRAAAVAVVMSLGSAVGWAQTNYEPYTFTTVAGVQAGSDGSVDGTGSAARFFYPFGVAVDSAGTCMWPTQIATPSARSPPGGVVTHARGQCGQLLAAPMGRAAPRGLIIPRGVAVDGSRERVCGGQPTTDTIRKITSAGVVTTLAGSAGATRGSADGNGQRRAVSLPTGVAVDGSGNCLCGGLVSTTPSARSPGRGGDDAGGQRGQARAAPMARAAPRGLTTPAGVAVDAAGMCMWRTRATTPSARSPSARGGDDAGGEPGSQRQRGWHRQRREV